jgi:hypothetical protein
MHLKLKGQLSLHQTGKQWNNWQQVLAENGIISFRELQKQDPSRIEMVRKLEVSSLITEPFKTALEPTAAFRPRNYHFRKRIASVLA